MIHEILLISNAICLLANCLTDGEKDIVNKIACILNFLAIVGLSLVLYFK